MQPNPIKLAFDVSPLSGMKAGIYRYVMELHNSLISLNANLHIDLYMGGKWIHNNIENITKENSNQYLNLITKFSDHFGEKVKLIRKELNYVNQKRVFHLGLVKYRPDLVHFTQNYIHTAEIPTLFTFYDMSCFRHPETHPKSRVLWQRKHVPLALEQATHIITISQFTKNELIDYFGINAEKISVIYCGVGNDFKRVNDTLLEPVLDKYHLMKKKYFLSIGTLEPRKNLEIIIKAYINLPKSIKENYRLVIVGAHGWGMKSLNKKYFNLVQSGQILFPGFVAQKHLPAIISGAIASLYPSIYEGFGLPVLESMSCGTPVIASNTSSIPEIVSDKSILVDPLDINKWSELMLRIIEDVDYAKILTSSGINKARNFTWKNCAIQTLNTYKKLLIGQ